MAGFKDPTFQERTAAAARAKEKALAILRAKPSLDEATIAERAARSEARAAAEAEKRAARQLAVEAARQAKLQAAADAEEAAAKNVQLSEADKKAARDARYAARKARK